MSTHVSSPTIHFWLALQIAGIGYRTIRQLMERFGTIDNVMRASRVQLNDAGASATLIDALLHARNATPDIDSISARNINVIAVDDPLFPSLLRETHSPPLVLYVRGSIEAIHGTCLSAVGTRKPSRYGIAATHRIVEPLAQRGVVIVSGLAFGIDAEVHRAALDAGGTTVAVLGNGIDEVYPRCNRALANEILEHNGAVIGEYPPGTEIQRHFFPQRNRIIAGVSAATLIIEAGVTSGALITARMALDENREVFAVPGPIDSDVSVGPNNLIKMGAMPTTRPEDLFEQYGLDRSPRMEDNATIHAETNEELSLLRLLGVPRHVDELVALSTLDTSTVNATLSLLEMKGRVRHLGGMQYIRTR
ncbi:MAG: DNA-processing protein DprA [Candidatus Kerfeldbacteria bacterium]